MSKSAQKAEMSHSDFHAGGDQKISSDNSNTHVSMVFNDPGPRPAADVDPSNGTSNRPPRKLKSPSFTPAKKERYWAVWDTKAKSQKDIKNLLEELRGLLREIKPDFDKLSKELELRVSIKDEWEKNKQVVISLSQLLSSFDKSYEELRDQPNTPWDNLFAGKKVWKTKIEIINARDSAKRVSDWFTRINTTPSFNINDYQESHPNVAQAVKIREGPPPRNPKLVNSLLSPKGPTSEISRVNALRLPSPARGPRPEISPVVPPQSGFETAYTEGPSPGPSKPEAATGTSRPIVARSSVEIDTNLRRSNDGSTASSTPVDGVMKPPPFDLDDESLRSTKSDPRALAEISLQIGAASPSDEGVDDSSGSTGGPTQDDELSYPAAAMLTTVLDYFSGRAQKRGRK